MSSTSRTVPVFGDYKNNWHNWGSGLHNEKCSGSEKMEQKSQGSEKLSNLPSG